MRERLIIYKAHVAGKLVWNRVKVVVVVVFIS